MGFEPTYRGFADLEKLANNSFIFRVVVFCSVSFVRFWSALSDLGSGKAECTIGLYGHVARVPLSVSASAITQQSTSTAAPFSYSNIQTRSEFLVERLGTVERLGFAWTKVSVDTGVSQQLFLSALFKVGMIVMLLVLLIGPMLQINDCFNDAPNLDHDAVSHSVDALLCFAFSLVLGCLLLWVLAISRSFERLLEQLHNCSFGPAFDRRTPFFSPHTLSLRI